MELDRINSLYPNDPPLTEEMFANFKALVDSVAHSFDGKTVATLPRDVAMILFHCQQTTEELSKIPIIGNMVKSAMFLAAASVMEYYTSKGVVAPPIKQYQPTIPSIPQCKECSKSETCILPTARDWSADPANSPEIESMLVNTEEIVAIEGARILTDISDIKNDMDFKSFREDIKTLLLMGYSIGRTRKNIPECFEER